MANIVRMKAGALIFLFCVAFVTSTSSLEQPRPSSTTIGAPFSSTDAIESKSRAQLSNVRQEFALALEKLKSAKMVLPSADEFDEVIPGIKEYVQQLSNVMNLESIGMSAEERQIVAKSHHEAALLHLSSVLPLFPTHIAKTSLFYTPDNVPNSVIANWKDDWLVRLAMAVEEDSATAAYFDNTERYIRHGLFPLNLPAALYHLNKAALLGHTSSRSLFAALSKIASTSAIPSSPLPNPTVGDGFKSLAKPTTTSATEKLVQKAVKSAVGSTSHTPPSESTSSESSSSPSTPSKLNSSPVARVADWKLLEHIFQDLGAGAKSPSALLSEGYQRLFGVDTQQQQCAIAKKSLKEATQPLLELIRTRVPSPFLEIDEHAVPPVKLNEQYTGQAMGSFKVPAEYDKMDLIDYYRLQADDPQLHAPKTAIGSIYLYGTYGFARDYKRAAYYFNAADKVQPSSQLGYMHHMGLVNGEVNMAKAIQLYSRAAAHNDSFALTQMGLLYLRGNTEANIKQDTRKALQYLGKAADKDEVNANFHLGFLYRNGYGPDIPIDPAKALKFIIVAASRGHLGALLELATLTGKCEDSVHLYFRVLHSVLLQPLAYRAHEFYNYGFYDHAAVLYNLMAAMGHETGQLNAAWLHERGLVSSASITLQDLSNLLPLNVPSLSANPSEAAAQLSQQSLSSLKSRIEEISEAGYIDATAHHAGQVDQYEEDYVDMVIDSNGRSTGPDREKASWEHQRHSFELYRLAAQQGSAEAQLKQGDFYYYGIGVAPDFNKSAQFYTLAATAKHAQATFNLGYMYQRGLGVAQDLHLAKRYYDAAMVASPDAYLAGSLALASLAIQDLFLGNSQPTHLSWDNSLLLFLTIVAFCTIIMKFRLRNRA